MWNQLTAGSMRNKTEITIQTGPPCMDFPCSSEDPETAWKTVLPARPWLRIKIWLRYSFLSQQAGYSLQIDHLGTLILSRSFCWILTAVDTFSRFVLGILMHSTDSGHTRQVYKATFFLFGSPEHISSYNRSGFVAQATHQWVWLWNIWCSIKLPSCRAGWAFERTDLSDWEEGTG